MKQVLITGATGFIGAQLVRLLKQQGVEVRCLVRKTSDRSRLDPYSPEYVVGELTDDNALARAVEGCQTVFNLAGTTKSLGLRGFVRANVHGPRSVARACLKQDAKPVLVHVSSLAASGPSTSDRARQESDCEAPVSNYGRSKLMGERAVASYADRLPISIVRPPIVLGPGDKDGFEMFQSASRFGVHVTPGKGNGKMSVVHVDDLCQNLTAVARRGQRLTKPNPDGQGIFYVGDHHQPTYAELGRMIGKAMGLRSTRVIPIPMPALWAVSAVNQWVSKLRGRPHILNLDKTREAAAGCWTCDPGKLREQLGFQPVFSLQERLNQTAQWYLDNGWLSAGSTVTEPRKDTLSTR
ncbi:3 beta-hydroxysteroid dehydrogenase/Delta 5--_4-isomerase [Stieleria bergensis]|uniref:3 beta-hydroxysteroid dehydrogenase/Delta 5-->4-isomerase n=1 Tax=Stieleria bergensis TaxID=2528025 RepID=A0A517SYI3_9BACT|nr:3 beta-hydroxysteroid dehydrogenase/Delta 5-->4-isomerase [Planctomycetes bacterium SV_7m_r]